MTAPTVTTLAALDQGHRVAQARNALVVQRLVMQLFVRMVDPKNVAATSGPWLAQAISAILRGRGSSIMLASAYAEAVRRIQAPDAPKFVIPRPEDPPLEQLIRSLTYTGPGKLAVDLAKTPEPVAPSEFAPHVDWEQFDRDRADYEQRVKELPAKAAVMASGAAYRHVNNGGRELIDSVVAHDPLAVGYIRIPKDKPCAFCLMLASRGPIYKEDSFDRSDPRFTGPGEHKAHDSCGCSLRPIYGSISTKNWTDQARKAETLWVAMTRETGKTGNAAIIEYRHRAVAAGLASG